MSLIHIDGWWAESRILGATPDWLGGWRPAINPRAYPTLAEAAREMVARKKQFTGLEFRWNPALFVDINHG